MERSRKERVVKELGEVFESSGIVVVARYAGLTVAEMQEFRQRVRAAGGMVRVAKNRLARIAARETPCEGVTNLLSGMTLLAYSADPVAAAKASEAFSKINAKLVVVGGAMDGNILDASGVKSVAELPSHAELIADIVGCISGPAAQIAGVLGAPSSSIAGLVQVVEELKAA